MPEDAELPRFSPSLLDGGDRRLTPRNWWFCASFLFNPSLASSKTMKFSTSRGSAFGVAAARDRGFQARCGRARSSSSMRFHSLR